MEDSSAKHVISELTALANPEIAAHSQGYFKTQKGEYGAGDVFLGIRMPVLRAQAKQFKRLPVDECFLLLLDKHHEIRLFALIVLVNQFKACMDDCIKKDIYNKYLAHTQYINNWDLVDSSAHQIIGGYLLNHDRAILTKLAKSKSLWERRIAIIATLNLIKKGQLDDTYQLAEILLNDQEDLIHKAVGWMLREAGKIDFEREQAFLNINYVNMPRTMLRYAIEKFPEPLRQQYLKGSI